MSTQPTTPSFEMPLLPLRDKELPPIIREVVSNAPTHRKLPAFVACLSPLCALATRIRLRYYYDGSRQSALLLQVIIEAPQSAGKQFAAAHYTAADASGNGDKHHPGYIAFQRLILRPCCSLRVVNGNGRQIGKLFQRFD